MLIQSYRTVVLMLALGAFLFWGAIDSCSAQNRKTIFDDPDGSEYSPLPQRHQTIFMPRDESQIQQTSQSPQVPDVLDAESKAALGIPPQLLKEDQVWGTTDEECVDCETFVPMLAHKSATGSVTWLPGNDDNLGIFTLYLSETVDLPRLEGFTITPRFGVHYLDGPVRTDLPARVYDTSVSFRWFNKVNEKWSYELEVAPGVYSDFKNVTSDSLRITGKGLAYYVHSRAKQFVMGVVYLDREDIMMLPAAGMIMWFSEGSRLELIFPKPKFTYRLEKDEHLERWAYVAGEFGGGSWAIRRSPGGIDDVVTYSDLRLIGGLETKHTNGKISQLEVGLVFSRSLEYESNIGNYDPSPTAMLRYQLTF